MGLIAQRIRSEIRTGKEVQKDPLPVGRYYKTVFGHPWIPIGPPPFEFGDLGQWLANETDSDVWALSRWLGDNAANIKIDKIETYPPLNPGGRPSLFVIWNNLVPLEWGMSERLGWPSEAGANIQTSTDVLKEKVDAGGSLLGDSVPSWVPWAIGGTIAVVGLVAVAKLVRG